MWAHDLYFVSIDEKDGLAVSLKESSQLVEHAKERDVQMQSKVKAMEHQLQVLTERDQEVSSAGLLTRINCFKFNTRQSAQKLCVCVSDIYIYS